MVRVQPRVLLLTVTTAILCGLGLPACGSSANTATAPSSLNRCAVTLNGGTTVPPQGGSGTIAVSAARECSWTAAAEGGWLSIRAGAGQGDGVVEFTASPNPDPATRRGAIVLNQSRFELTQAAGECAFSLALASAAVPPEGGGGQVDLRASSALCTWSAEPEVEWIAVGTRQGTGSALVPFTVGPLGATSSRTGRIRVAGLQFTVTQADDGCTYTIAPASHTAGANGATGTLSIATGPGCPWSAASGVSWLTFSPPAGVGPATVTFSVAPSAGASRSTTATVAGQPFTVSQAGSAGQECSYRVEPAAHVAPAAGGTLSSTVHTGATCVWTASSPVPWITVSGRTSFVGTDTVTLVVAPHAGGDRSDTVMIAGQAVPVLQAAGCTYGLSATSLSMPAEGGSSSVAVTAGAACPWTASSHADWIAITGGAAGSGNGSVGFQVAPLASGSRSGTMTIAGQTVTVTQSAAPACTSAIAPGSRAIEAAGGTLSVNVTAAAGCSWTATSDVPWMVVVPAAGAGSGSVDVQVQANTGPARTGTATIAGRTFTVEQAAAPATACTYQIQPTTVDRNWRSWDIQVTVSTSAGCAWTASTSAAWLTIVSDASGEGSGTVVLRMAENTGPDRSTTALVAGQPVDVTQRRRN